MYWNGRDRYDEPLPPGEYTWKLAAFEGMGTKFHGSVGNSARPPFRTPDGKGSMGGFGAVVSDGESAYRIHSSRKEQPTTLPRLEIDTGKDIPFANGEKKIEITKKAETIGGIAAVGGRLYYGLTDQEITLTEKDLEKSIAWRSEVESLRQKSQGTGIMKVATTGGNYEISITLDTLGFKPASGAMLKGDIGILRGEGNETKARVYWSNKATSIVSDVPEEAMLNPKLWGTLEFR